MMMEKDINSTHVFYMANLSDNVLKEIEKELTEKFGNNNAVCYTIKKGYGFNTGCIQLEAMYDDNVIFVGAVRVITEVMMNVKPLWHVDEDRF